MKKEILGYRNDPNILNVNFDSLGDINGNLGNYVDETKHEIGMFNTENSTIYNGVYIFQDFINKKIAYRIYKDFADYKYISYTDDILISKLRNKQSNIKLSEFPYGIVTVENKIIGQVIPYYEKSNTVLQLFDKKNFGNKIPTNYLLEMLKIQRELLQNGIISCDCHPKNFVVVDDKVKPIDFETEYVYVDNYSDSNYERMIDTLKHNIYGLSIIANLPTNGKDIIKVRTLDELEEEVQEMDYLLKKTKK